MIKHFIKFQASTNSLKNENAMLGTTEIVLIMVVTVVIVALLFVFAKNKVVGTANATGANYEKAMNGFGEKAMTNIQNIFSRL